MYGSVCRECGAKDEGLSAEVGKGAERIAAERNFASASTALDLAYCNRLDSGSFWKRFQEWRERFAKLRALGGL